MDFGDGGCEAYTVSVQAVHWSPEIELVGRVESLPGGEDNIARAYEACANDLPGVFDHGMYTQGLPGNRGGPLGIRVSPRYVGRGP